MTRRVEPAQLYASPNALAADYSRFRVGERLPLTGHSHQAWPDVAERGQLAAFADAAELGDDKWERAFARAERVRQGFARLLDDGDGVVTLGANTHELLVRFLSALPWRRRRRLVTTDLEFHSARRQLDRLEEEGVAVRRVAALPAESVGERLAAAVDDRTAAVIVSTVFYANAHLAGGLERAAAACRRHGAALLLDVYHQLNAMPLSLREAGLEDAFVVGGGYKYCQLGEGNGFLRVPAGCALRPVVTGWFAEFGKLEETPAGNVGYGPGPWRFAGATYDPTSHYRAAEVFDVVRARGLGPAVLRTVSQHQVALLAERFDALDLPPERVRRDRSQPLERLGGFLAL
ncbi:MAG TPA: kynureninase, partial [Thermoanaerobaculia bacterium]|nr:kynureninase [Thermoanaerobaculia bacterium]